MAPFGSVHFSFGNAMRAASTFLLIQSSNLENISWNASVFWSNLIGETFPTALITQWCHTEWIYLRCISDCVHALPTGTHFHQRCLEVFFYAWLVWERMAISNCDAWVQHDEEHITTYMGYGYVMCHNPALEHRHSTGQYWYTCISLPGPNTTQISLFIIIPSSLSNK